MDADGNRLRRNRTLLGHVLENFVAMELIQQVGWSNRRCRPFHFRTESGAEVDLVLEDPAGRPVGVAVKSAASARQQDFRGLEELARLSGDRFARGIVLCTGTTVVPFGRNLHQMPVSQVWA